MSLSSEAKESLLQAMNIIASKATEGLAFDTTIKCVITNNDNASDGYYTVQYENTKFTVYSENSLYKVGECVRVSVPNNNLEDKKYILGKWAGDDGSEPITYTSVSNTVLEIVNLVDDQNLNIGLEANGTTKKKNIPLPDMSTFFGEVTQNEIFDTLFIEIELQSQLENYEITRGNYGIKLLIYDKTGYVINTLVLDSEEFFGNPYAFTVPIQQSKKLNISDLGQIGSVGLDFYQNSNFFCLSDEGKDEDGNIIQVQMREVPLTPVGVDNIFLKGVKIGFGSDLSHVEDNTVKIFCGNDSDLSYEYSDRSKEKEISLIWYNKTSDNTYVGFSDGIAQQTIESDTFNYTNYDENDYLNISAQDSKLKAQIADSHPANELTLALKSNVFTEGSPAVKEVYSILSKDLPSTLQSISSRIGSNCRDITDELDAAKEGVLEIKGIFDENIMSKTQAVYSVKNYTKGAIIKDSEFQSIVKIKYENTWYDIKEDPLNKFNNNQLSEYFFTVDRVEYVVKKNVSVKIRKDLKVYPVEQQIIDLLVFGKECETYNDIKNEDKIRPSYDIIKEIYSDEGKGENYNFITKTYISTLIDNAIGYIEDCRDAITDLTDPVSGNYKSFTGVWAGQLPKIEALIESLEKQQKIINNKLPSSIQVTINNTNKSGQVKINFKRESSNVSLTYSTTSWNYTNWESEFDDSIYANLYSVYWFQYSPGWEPEKDSKEETNKIYFKDWKNISPTVDSIKSKYLDKLNKAQSLIAANDASKDQAIKAANSQARKIINFCGLNNNKAIQYDVNTGLSKITNASAYSKNANGLIIINNNVLNKLPSHINLGLPTTGDQVKDILYWGKNSVGENIPQKTVKLDSEKTNTERFKVVIIYNHSRYESNEIVFSNIDKAVNLTLTDKDFQIANGSDSRDNYQDLYNFTNELISPAEATKERALYAKFKNPTDENEEAFNKSWIYWYVPSGATMITYDESKLINDYGFYTDKQKTVKANKSTYLYKYIMDDGINKTKDVGDKIILHNHTKINNVTYYCINKEKNYYLPNSNVTLETTKKLVYPKIKGEYYHYYYETTPELNGSTMSGGLKLTFSEKVEIKIDTNLYPDLYVNVNKEGGGKEWKTFASVKNNNKHFSSKSSNVYIPLYKMEARCSGVVTKTGSDYKYGGNNFYFLNTSTRYTKAIRVTEGDHKKQTTITLYPTSTPGKFMATKDLKVEAGVKIGFVKGSSTNDKTVKLYKYRIKNYGNTINSGTLKIVEKEFYDSSSKKTYYKLYEQEIYLLKTDFDTVEPKYGREGYYCFYKQVAAYDGSQLNEEATENNKKFYYKIKSLFNQDATNNTIMCGIEGDRWGLEETLAVKDFSFGTYGANGTEYSIRIEPDRKLDSSTNKIKTYLKIKLYNGAGEEQDFSEPAISWIGPTSCNLESIQKKADGYLVTLVDRVGEEEGSGSNKYTYTPYNYYAALRIEIKLEEVDLETVYSIPYSAKESYCIDGTSSVVYNMDGNAEENYYLEQYKIYDTATSTIGNISDVTWLITYIDGVNGGRGSTITGTTEAEIKKIRYMPKFDSTTNTLKPLKMFIDNVDCYASVICKKGNNVLWTQPIVILQNRFMSTTLNKWSGEFELDEDEGTILSAMVGAGKKNSDNSFSGVLMGDVKEKGGFDGVSSVQTGLYGFHEGSMSFGFDINGKAFLGKSGKGRISFDGNHGMISSALWDGAIDDYGVTTLGTKGMLIDLENGHIDAHDFRLTSQNIGLDSNPVINDEYGTYGYYIRIGNNSTKNGKQKTRGYLTLNSNGDLDIRVNSLHLTEQLGGANLLRQSQPSKMVTQWVVPTTSEVNALLNGVTVSNITKNNKYYKADSDGNCLVETNSGYNKYLYLVDATGERLEKRNEDSSIILYWDVDTSLKHPSTSQWIGVEQTNPDDNKKYRTSITGIDSFSFYKVTNKNGANGIEVEAEPTSESAVCIKTERPTNLDAYIAQEVSDIIPGEKYTISGYVRRRKQKVDGNETLKHRFYVNISDSENLPLSEANLNVTDHILISNQEWTYFEKNVILKLDTEQGVSNNLKNKKITITFKSDVDFLLYHAKLEQGSVATDWDFSKWDIQQGAKHEVDAYDKQLTQDKIFKTLITNPNNGEQMVGIWMIDKDPMTNATLPHKELYINATYIATGILKSRNWNGNVTRRESCYYNSDGTKGSELKDEYGRPIYTYDVDFYNVTTPRGMYINLDEGKVWAATFELNAWDDGASVKKGLYLNSHPISNGDNNTTYQEHYLLLGDQKNGNYISFSVDNKLTIKTGIFNLNAGTTSGKHLFLNSDGAGGYYFRVGNSTNHLSFSRGGSLDIKSSSFTLSTSGNSIYIGNTGITVGTGDNQKTNIVLKMGDNFMVDSTGKLYADSAVISGTMTVGANSKIAGWDISANQIYKTVTQSDGEVYQAYLTAMSNTGDPSSTAAFGIYTKTKNSKGKLVDDWPFYIRYDGTFHAENADISGVIRATTLSIGGTGSESYVKGVANITYINSLGITAKTFSAETVDGKSFTSSTLRTGTEDNNVYISSAGATFSWGGNPYGTITTTQTVPRNDMENVGTFWTLLADKTNVDAISFGFNSSGTPAYFLYHDAGLYSNNCAAHNFKGGDVYCTGSLVSEGTISANKFFTNSDVVFCGSLSVRKTVGNILNLQIKTEAVFEGTVFSSSNVVSGGNQGIGIRQVAPMQFKNTTYDSSGGIATISDKNHKNSIQTIPESYENLFISLEPVIFKYNSGTSNRYHMGFIAQDLKENLYNNNISIDSFASYVEYGEVDDEGNETFMSSIRYNEFIALNTHMIQICLKRINELEKEIKDLKS